MNMNIFSNSKVIKKIGAVMLWSAVVGCAYDPAMEEEVKKSDVDENESGSKTKKKKSSKEKSNSEENGIEVADKGIDFVVNNHVILTGVPEKIGRLIFMKDAILSTDGSDLVLVVDEIISHSGTISTFPISTKPRAGGSGKSGGSLRLETRTGRGRLTILSHGQDGAQGTKGRVGASGSKGPRGRSGVSDSIVECLMPFQPAFCATRNYCKKQTGDGGLGGQGKKGGAGTQGGNGGNSAQVFVKIEDPSQLNIFTDIQVGLGGLGGLGGDGGKGGKGGDGGKRDHAKECRVAKQGPIGLRGPQGAQGRSGSDGLKMPVCLVLGTARIGDCDAFRDK